MIEIVYSELCKKLGEPIVNEFILPFSYQTQNSDLLIDIRNFVNDKNICDFLYPEERYPINEKAFLFSHLVDFSMNHRVKNHIRIGKIIKYFKYKRDVLKINPDFKSIINLFLGALTPNERDLFINEYVINEYEDEDENEDMTIDNSGDWLTDANGESW